MEEVYEFLKKCGTYFVATLDGDQPRVRPFSTILMVDGSLYIQTGKIKKVSRQMKDNPKIEICSCLGSKWLRIEAVAIEDENSEIKQKMLDAFPVLKSMYSADDENNQVLYLQNATATFYAFGEEPKTVKF